MRIYALLAGIAGWASILAEYSMVDRFHSLTMTVNFFCYFSTLSNIMAALVMSCAGLQKHGTTVWLTEPFAATAVALYVGITGLPFIIQLIWAPFGLVNSVDFRLHYVMPVVYMVYWAICVPRGTLKLHSVLLWLIFPLLFGIFSLVRGTFTGFYPLPFLDLGVWSLAHVLISMGFMLLALLVLGGVLLLVDQFHGWLRARAQ